MSSMQHGGHDSGRDTWTLGDLGARLSRTAWVAGALGIAASVGLGFAGGDLTRFYQAWHVSFCYWLSICLGALFFVLIQHLTGATWSVVVRRPAEVMAANLPVLLVLFVPIALGMRSLFEWARPEALKHDASLREKAAYLNATAFLVRWAIYFGLWFLITRFFYGRSVAQDKTGDLGDTLKMEKRAAPAMVIFALTTTFAAVDLLMSLTPHWSSTIYGVYFFTGSALSFFSFLAISVVLLQRTGRLRSVSPEHFHDLGKLMFAFVVFWAYIGFSQYMLIWYANIPEETTWYRARQTGGWTAVSVCLIFGHFILPFAGLIGRWAKKRAGSLGFWAVWLLIVHWFDIYWLAMPAASPGKVPFHLLDLTSFVGIGGVLIGVAAARLSKVSLVPARDPRLGDSIVFENV